ncbi:hypothetical protein MHL40_09030 [Pseudomonas luteola]|uniref:hypothetical protein n=1 Tax=Pseudomonas luteola TaxID=47886 RepID=UPI001EF54628|nr:hypothetical protein [Pseudomonas luteola]MCG7372818.1 hypothetical protein [Pseudomonas luteola]
MRGIVSVLQCCGAALLLAAGSAMAEPELLQGTVGQAKVLVELDLAKPDEVTGRYFYQKYHTDIALDGALDKQRTLRLSENRPFFSTKSVPMQWTLKQGANGRWTGRWASKGKTLDISLSPVALPPARPDDLPALDELRRTSPYEYLRLKGLSLKKDRQDTFMGYGLQWWVEPVSRIRLFQLVSSPTAMDLSAANRTLQNRQWQEVNSYFGCLSGARDRETEFDQTVKPVFINDSVLSVSLFTSYDCGGAHPDFGDAPLNMELATGKILELEDVFWLGKGPSIHYERGMDNLEAYSNYREQLFAPWVVDQFKRLYPELMNDDPNECNYQDPSVWQFSVWYFEPRGIYLGPTFARAARSCDEPGDTVIPYKTVKAHPGPVKVTLPE